jgi:hypothetical protein
MAHAFRFVSCNVALEFQLRLDAMSRSWIVIFNLLCCGFPFHLILLSLQSRTSFEWFVSI